MAESKPPAVLRDAPTDQPKGDGSADQPNCNIRGKCSGEKLRVIADFPCRTAVERGFNEPIMLQVSKWPAMQHRIDAAFKVRTVLSIGDYLPWPNHRITGNIRQQESDHEHAGGDNC